MNYRAVPAVFAVTMSVALLGSTLAVSARAWVCGSDLLFVYEARSNHGCKSMESRVRINLERNSLRLDTRSVAFVYSVNLDSHPTLVPAYAQWRSEIGPEAGTRLRTQPWHSGLMLSWQRDVIDFGGLEGAAQTAWIRRIVIPYWMIWSLTAVYPILLVRRVSRRRRSSASGFTVAVRPTGQITAPTAAASEPRQETRRCET